MRGTDLSDVEIILTGGWIVARPTRSGWVKLAGPFADRKEAEEALWSLFRNDVQTHDQKLTLK